MDDEDKQFLMELTNNLFKKKQEELSNRLNESKAIGAMARAAQEEDMGEEMEEREEAKEEEYDYFLENMQDENAGGAQGYHIIDENDLNQDDEEDLEEIDEEERKQRHREMLKEFKERMERDDRKAQK